jgi:hypothetical protein
MDQAITDQSTSYLRKLSQLEARLLNRLQTKDSGAASRLPPADYEKWEASLQHSGALVSRSASTYVPGLDTLATTLKYLQSRQVSIALPGAASTTAATVSSPLALASSRVQALQGKLNETNLIQQYISQRRQDLAQLLSRYTQLPPQITRAFARYKATVYYYHQQVEQYKAMLNDPQKIEQTAVAILSKSSAYQQFLAKNSLLASLFRLPAGYGSGTASTKGLQTQDQVQQTLQQQVGGSGGAAIQQQVQGAAAQMSSIQNAVSKYGAGGQDLNMPSFQPNSQKTKTFLARLEYGTNLQVTNSSYNFPTTAALALTLGYKINDKSTAGVGLSYNLGIGSGWKDIHFSNQGLGLRSYMDFKIKKTYYVTGGYELNYMSEFSSIEQLRSRSAWQPSALIGLEKKYRISSKLQGNIQLLFDALYKQEIPQGQMFKFRVGYNF